MFHRQEEWMGEMKRGTVLWYDKRDGHGIIVDEAGNELYVDSSVLIELNYLSAKDKVLFEINQSISDTLCAHKVSLAFQCEGGNPVGTDGGSCDAEGCQ